MTARRIFIAYLLIVILAQAVFASFPGIDLAVSRLFHTPDQGFVWTLTALPTVNLVIRHTGEGLTFLLIGVVLFGLVTRVFSRTTLQLLAYPALTSAIAAGVIVNLVFKTHVGRARPHAVTEFGGTAAFTPPWQVTNQCLDNCSFTSGEAALAASLAIPVLVIFWPHLSRAWGRPLALLAAVTYIAGASLLRIGLGRHFLSDTIFSVLIAVGVALALYPLLRIAEARQHLPLPSAAKPGTDPVDRQRVS